MNYTRFQHNRARGVLVMFEVAVATLAIISAGLPLLLVTVVGTRGLLVLAGALALFGAAITLVGFSTSAAKELADRPLRSVNDADDRM